MASYQASSPYSVVVEIASPERQSRLSVFFRSLLVLPHAVIVGALNYAVQVIVLIVWFVVVVTGRFPAGLWNFVCGYLRWSTRVNAYALLLTGRYPPFAFEDVPEYRVRLHAESETAGRNRLTVLFRLILIIPHVVALYLLAIVGAVVLLLAWFAAVFTGHVPDGLHNFLAGLLRWSTRVNAYVLLLTDRYPPFSFD